MGHGPDRETTRTGDGGPKHWAGRSPFLPDFEDIVEQFRANIHDIASAEQHDPRNLAQEPFGQNEGANPGLGVELVERLFDREARDDPAASRDQRSRGKSNRNSTDGTVLFGQGGQGAVAALKKDRAIIQCQGEDSTSRYPGDESRCAVQEEVGRPCNPGSPHATERCHDGGLVITQRRSMPGGSTFQVLEARPQHLDTLGARLHCSMQREGHPLELLKMIGLEFQLLPPTLPPTAILDDGLPLVPQFSQHLIVVIPENPPTGRARRIRPG